MDCAVILLINTHITVEIWFFKWSSGFLLVQPETKKYIEELDLHFFKTQTVLKYIYHRIEKEMKKLNSKEK